MARPKAVRKSADDAQSLAEKIVEQQRAGREEGSRSADQLLSEYLDAPPASKKPAEPEASESLSEQHPSENGPSETPTNDAQEADNPPKPEGKKQPQHDADDPYKEIERLERAYSVLQGKYNSEVPRLHRELKQAKDENARLQQQGHSTAQGDEEITDPTMRELMEEYPEDLVKGIYRMVKSATGDNAKPTNDSGTPPPEAQSDDGEKDAVAARMELLTEMVPDWRQVDVTDGFKQWINAVEPMSGRTRMQLMNEAWNADDIIRVAKFFKTYKADAGIGQRTKPPAERNVEPESRSSQQPAADRPDQRIWTVAEVEAINKKERNGEFRRHPEKLRRLRADIEKAAAEGRLR